MIAKEAIETLKANYPDACYGQLREAVDAAIEALKAQDAAGDTIYRQDAIRTLEDGKYSTDYCKEHGIDHSINMEMVRILLNDLPSAQPEIVYCKDCICGHGEVWLSGNGSADLYGYCGRTQLRVLPYDYCSYAKRRTDEQI